jgi:thymidylate synthase
MIQYKKIVHDILTRGVLEDQRALVNGEKVQTKAVYCQRIDINLQLGFPLLTLKRTPLRLIKEELKWFIRGEDNVTSLKSKDVNIWNEWADDAGNLGPSYPSSWRRFGGSVGHQGHTCGLAGKDQIAELEGYFRDWKESSGASDRCIRDKRRVLLTSWNPNIRGNKGPVGCHTLAQWFPVKQEGGDKLHCHMYMRSVDVFLGLPFNIACYALLTELLARIGGLTAEGLTITMGNCHIYENHLPQCRELVHRVPKGLPRLLLDVDSLTDGKWDASVEGYYPHDALKGEIAV